jgi:hypothetical protein
VLAAAAAAAVAGIHEAPDDSWLMPYEPDKQQQHEQELQQHHQQHHGQEAELELMQQQEEVEELQQHQHQQQHQPQRRDSYGGEERLPANPSLSSWQTHGTAAAVQGGGRASRGGVSVGGSRLGQQGSGSRIEALLDDFEQGVTPSLLDLAEL